MNKNVQIYQLAALFHANGIVRYKKIMSKKNTDFNIIEDDDSYFKIVNDEISIQINEKNRWISVK